MSQPFGSSTNGALFTSLNPLEMLGQPGVASKLTHSQVATAGIYPPLNGSTISPGS